jgi:hypothetical protein
MNARWSTVSHRAEYIASSTRLWNEIPCTGDMGWLKRRWTKLDLILCLLSHIELAVVVLVSCINSTYNPSQRHCMMDYCAISIWSAATKLKSHIAIYAWLALCQFTEFMKLQVPNRAGSTTNNGHIQVHASHQHTRATDYTDRLQRLASPARMLS